MNPNCEVLGHDWASTGLYIDGQLHLPCRRPDCEAALCRARVIDGIYSSRVGAHTLDIEDDACGGVAKIIMREVVDSYKLDGFTAQDGDVILDIGAHVGIVSIYLAKCWPGTRIYAFEPVRENFANLERNVKVNAVTNVKAFRLAVSGNGRPLRLRGNMSQNSGGVSAYAGGNGRARKVKSVTLKQIFTNLEIDRCKLLKIDCEGAEYEILESAGELLSKVDYLVGEFHTSSRLAQMGYSPQRLLDLCQSHIPADRLHVNTCRMSE